MYELFNGKRSIGANSRDWELLNEIASALLRVLLIARIALKARARIVQ